MNDFFQRLGLDRRFTLDLAEVERVYLARSRQLHPDFHGEGSDAEKQASLELSAALNEAVVALRDHFRRAEHLLKLHGGPSAGEEKVLDQAFLMEMMEFRERIDDAKSDSQERGAIEAELSCRLGELLAAAGAPFDEPLPPSAADLIEVRRKLNAANTLKSLLRDLAD